jgi:hypothetical protein
VGVHPRLSDPNTLCLGAEKEKPGVAIERMLPATNFDEGRQLLSGQWTLHHPAGLESDTFDQRLAAEGGDALDLDELGGLQARDHIARGEVVFVLRRHRGVLLTHLDVFFPGGFVSRESSSSFISTSRFTRNGSGTRLPFSQWFTVL